MLCLQQTQTDGHCVPYCDSTHGCPTGQACTPAQLIGTSQIAHVCFGAGGGTTDAGSGGDAGSDTGTASDAASE